MLTEQSNPRTEIIDRLPTLEMLYAINNEDRRVALAVQEAIPRIAEAVDATVERLERGGRLIYVGAGTSGRIGAQDAAECIPTFNVPPGMVVALIAGGESALIHPAEGAEDSVEMGRADLLAIPVSIKDVVVGIAASGTTPYVLSAMVTASEVGAFTIG